MMRFWKLSLMILILFPSQRGWAAASRGSFSTSDYLDIGNSSSLSPSIPWTVFVLAYPTNINHETMMTNGRGGVSGFMLGGDQVNAIVFCKLGVVCKTGTSTTNLSANLWYAVGVVVTSTNIRIMNIKLTTGVLSGENFSDSNTFTGSPTEAQIGVFRLSNGNLTRPFVGNIFAAGVWAYAASDAEFAEWAYHPTNKFPSPKGFWYAFGDSPEIDVGGTDKDATVQGTPTTSQDGPLVFLSMGVAGG